jgi:signal transduction histidine kinase
VSLTLRLLVAFGLVAILATLLVGVSVREASRQIIESETEDRIQAAAAGAHKELAREAENLRGLLTPLCEHDTFVDRAHLELERARGDGRALESASRMRLRFQVPEQAAALRLDELSLVTGDGLVLGSTDLTRLGTVDARMARLLAPSAVGAPSTPPRLRPSTAGGDPAIEVECRRAGGGVTLGLIGARRIATILADHGSAFGVRLRAVDPAMPPAVSTTNEAVRTISVPEVAGLVVVAAVSRDRLKVALARLDGDIALTGAAALGVAIAMAVGLARSLGRPIAALARATRDVVRGEPREVEGRGGKEIAELAASFNWTIRELSAMKRRLAATERIAARREVGRQVAHEIKNPLAPIRTAVETLRRLRARGDPQFDAYFDEASRTVLDEVHRIATIVEEFTKFQRLPAPCLARVDLVQLARKVVKLHDMGTEDRATRHSVELVSGPMGEVMADGDQMVQVLTNLVQNGIEAASAVREDPHVVVSIAPTDGNCVRVVVRDNGPGVSDAMRERLFEPYATSKDSGTGLGLAICQRIALEHGGELSCHAAAKGGAVFELVLPVDGPAVL